MKKQLICCMLVLLASAFAFTQWTCDEHTKSYLKLDENTGTAFADACSSSVGDNPATGTVFWGTGINGSAIDFRGAQTDSMFTNTTLMLGYSAVTIEAWVQMDANNSYRSVVDQNSGWGLVINAGKLFCGGRLNDAQKYFESTWAGLSTGGWWHVACVYNGTHITGFARGETDPIWTNYDNTLGSVEGTGATQHPASQNYCLGAWGTNCDAGNFFDGRIDEVRISTTARYPIPPPETSITVTPISPHADAMNNTAPTNLQYSYTASLEGGDTITGIHLYLNKTKSQTNTTAILPSEDGAFTHTFTADTEETATWFVSVETSAGKQYNSTERTFYWDDIAPLINSLVPAEAATITANSFEFSFTVTDTNLFAVNASVYNSTGDMMYNKTEYGVTSPYNFNETVNIATHANGDWQVVVEASDDHNKISTLTKKGKLALGTITTNTPARFIEVKGSGVEIKIEDKTKNGEWKSVKTFPNVEAGTLSYTIVTGNVGNDIKKYNFRVWGEGLTPITDTKYMGHLLRAWEYYVDFEGVSGSAVADCKEEYCDVEITTRDNTLKIESIGGVNVVSATNNFVVAKTHTYAATPNPTPAFYNQAVNLNATNTGTVNAESFEWNMSDGQGFGTQHASAQFADITLITWNFTAKYIDSTVYTANGTLNVLGMQVRIFDQTSATELTFNITVTNTTTSETYTDRKPFLWGNLTGGIPFGSQTLLISAVGYDSTFLYSTYNSLTSAVVNGYLLSSSSINRVCPIFDVKAGTEAVEGAVLTFQKQYNASWLTVGQIKTDGSGTAQICLDSSTMYQVTTAATGYDPETRNITPLPTTYYINLGDDSDWTVYNLEDTTYFYFVPVTNEINTAEEVIELWLYDAQNRITYAALTVANTTGDIICSETTTTQPTRAVLTCDLSAAILTFDRFAPLNATVVFRLGTVEYNATVLYYPFVRDAYQQSAYTGIFELGEELDDTSKWFIAVFLTAFAAAGISMKMGGEGAGFVALLVGGMFAYMGWFPLYLYIISAFVAVVAILTAKRGVG